MSETKDSYTQGIAALRDILRDVEDDELESGIAAMVPDILFKSEDDPKFHPLTLDISRRDLAASFVTLTAILAVVREHLEQALAEHHEECDTDHEVMGAAMLDGFGLAIIGVASAGLATADMAALTEGLDG